MKQWLTRQNIWIFIVGFTLCSFAISERINSWGIIMLVIFFIADRNLLNKIKQPFQWRKAAPLMAFFIVYLVFFLFSEKDADASHSLVSKLSFLILPLILSYESYFNKEAEQKLMLFFSIIISLGILYGIGSSVAVNFLGENNYGWSYAFNRMQVSKAIMHPGYYSNYFMLGILWHFFNKSKYQIFFIAFFSLVLLLLMSRIVLIFYILFIGFALLRYILKSKKPWLSLAITILVTTISSILLYQIPSIKGRIVDTISGISTAGKDTDYKSATASRTIAYKSEWNLIKQKPMAGYGLGNAVESLQQELRSTSYHKLAEKMHIHNQYFNTWLHTGILGVLALIFLLSSLLRYFYKKKIWTAFWFTILVAMNLLTDDMLEIQAGIVFFLLVWTLFLFSKKEIRTQ